MDSSKERIRRFSIKGDAGLPDYGEMSGQILIGTVHAGAVSAYIVTARLLVRVRKMKLKRGWVSEITAVFFKYHTHFQALWRADPVEEMPARFE